MCPNVQKIKQNAYLDRGVAQCPPCDYLYAGEGKGGGGNLKMENFTIQEKKENKPKDAFKLNDIFRCTLAPY